MRTEIPCPSCGAPVPFNSGLSTFAVCTFCRSMVVRHDIDLEIIGVSAVVPDNISPLQVGTTGKWDGKSFGLSGRTVQSWEAGSWSEWCAMFSDGSVGWLAEAQGFWMMSFQVQLEFEPPAAGNLKTGQRYPFHKRDFEVADIKAARCTSVEGELPFSPPYGEEKISADMIGPMHQYATLDYGPDGVRGYLGAYRSFEEFKFRHLRTFTDWPMEKFATS